MILLIDDDAAALDLRALIFEHHGFQTSKASTVEQARAVFHEHQPSAVVMDLRIPSTEDGLALIREFRGTSTSVRLIVLSGWPADLDRCPEARMIDALFAKPAHPSLLIQAVTAS